jgi:hypothetical protein
MNRACGEMELLPQPNTPPNIAKQFLFDLAAKR